MANYGISTNAEAEAVLAKLRTLSAECYEGVPQGEDMDIDEWGEVTPYRDVTFGSIIPTQRAARALGLGEADQVHGWTFEVAHTAATRGELRELVEETDQTLIGWVPTANSTEIKPYYYVQYASRNVTGAIISHSASRFYELIVGVLTP